MNRARPDRSGPRGAARALALAAALGAAGCTDELDKDGVLGNGEFEYQCGTADAACSGAREIFGFDLDRDLLTIAVGGRFSITFDGASDRVFPASPALVPTVEGQFTFAEAATVDFVAMDGDAVVDFAAFTAVAPDAVGLFRAAAPCSDVSVGAFETVRLAAAPLRGSEALGGGMRYEWDLGDGTGPQTSLGNVVTVEGSAGETREVKVLLGELGAACTLRFEDAPSSASSSTGTGGCDGGCTPPCDDGTLEAGEVCFLPPTAYATGDTPFGVVLADFDGDARLDVATANFNGATVTVRAGLGDGTLSADAAAIPVGALARTLASGDFDGDGQLDLAVTNFGAGTVGVLFGKGNLAFEPMIGLEALGAPHTVAARDLDADGKLDLVVSLYDREAIAVFMGTETGFAAPVEYEAGAGPGELAVEDVNADGKSDVVVVNEFTGRLAVLAGLGDGTFAAPASYEAGGTPGSVAVGRLNGDEWVDAVVVDAETEEVLLFTGRSDGTLDAPLVLASGPKPLAVRIADLNLDGLSDVLVTNAAPGQGTLSVLLGSPSGALGAPVAFPAGSLPAALAVGDLDAAAASLDVVVTNNDADTVSVLRFDDDG